MLTTTLRDYVPLSHALQGQKNDQIYGITVCIYYIFINTALSPAASPADLSSLDIFVQFSLNVLRKLSIPQVETVADFICVYNAAIHILFTVPKMSITSYQKMLEEEQLRVSQLEKELTQHKALIEALTALTGSTTAVIEPKTVVPEKKELADEDRVPTYIRKDSLPLLRAIKDQALSADAIATYCQQAGAPTNRETVLLRLGMYRRNYGMVESSESGLYQLTEKGKKYLEERYPEQPAAGKLPTIPSIESAEPVATDRVPSLWK